MADQGRSFYLEYQNVLVHIQELQDFGQSLFRATFDTGPPLLIKRVKDEKGEYFWTSVSQGRENLAAEIGALIQKHYRAKK